MVKFLRFALLLGPLAFAACGLSDQDRALLSSANQNAAAAKEAADRAAAAAEQAAAQARQNAQVAQQMQSEQTQRNLRK
jgi:hypothetical protein